MNKNTKRLHEIHFPNHSDTYILNDAETDAQNAWAYGTNAKALANSSHAEGKNTLAQDEGSHVEGLGTQSSGDYSHVQGKYNQPVENHAFVIGGGSEDNPKNIYSMDWEGNSSQSGNLSVQGKITGDTFSFSNDKLIMEDGQVKYLWHDGTHKEIATMSDIPKINADGSLATYGLSFNKDEGTLNFTSIVKGENETTPLHLSETFIKKIDLPINDTTITFKPTTDKNIYLTYGNNLETGKNGYYLEDFGTSIGTRKILSTADYPDSIIPINKGGTGATTASDARTKLGLGTMATKNTNESLNTGRLLITSTGNTQLSFEPTSDEPNNYGSICYDHNNNNKNIYFMHYPTGTSGVYESFSLPATTRTSGAKNYQILTDKTPVTIEQGGTNATTAAGARTQLGLGSMATEDKNDYPKFNGNNNIVYPNSIFKMSEAWITTTGSNSPGIKILHKANDTSEEVATAAIRYDITSTDTSGLKYRLYFSQAVAGSTNTYERYYLPAPNNSSGNYRILTTRNTLTIGQGGTGATTALEARKALGVQKTVFEKTGYMSTNGTNPDGTSGAATTKTFNFSNDTDEIIGAIISAYRSGKASNTVMWLASEGNKTFSLTANSTTVSATISRSSNKKSVTVTPNSTYAADWHLIFIMN